MSFVNVAPDVVAQSAGNLESIGSTLHAANAWAAPPTVGVLAPAADEVSTAIASLLGAHAQEFQTLSAQATTFHSQFVNLLKAGAGQYVSTEVANAQQVLTNAVNTVGQTALGHPLIGAGTSSARPAAQIPINRGNILLFVEEWDILATDQILVPLSQLDQSLLYPIQNPSNPIGNAITTIGNDITTADQSVSDWVGNQVAGYAISTTTGAIIGTVLAAPLGGFAPLVGSAIGSGVSAVLNATGVTDSIVDEIGSWF